MPPSHPRTVLALIAALTVTGVPAGSLARPLAQVIPAQPSGFQTVDKLAVQATAIHYSTPDSGRPGVTVYVTARNISASPMLISTATIEASLTSGSAVFTQATPQVNTLRDLPPSMEAPTGAPGPHMLAAGATIIIAMRFDGTFTALRSPLTLNFREKPLTPFHRGGGRTTLSFPAHSPIGQRLPDARLETPAPQPTTTGHAGNGRFIEAAPWRARLDEAVYGATANTSRGTGLTVVKATIQNTRNIPLRFRPSEWSAVVAQSDGARTANEGAVAISINGVNQSGAEITVPSGATFRLEMMHYLKDAAAQHRARQWILTHRPANGQPSVFDHPMPMPPSAVDGTADTSQRPQDPTVNETVNTPGQPFRSLSRLGVTVVATQYGFINATHTRGIMTIRANVKNISAQIVRMEPDLVHARLEAEGKPPIVGRRAILRYGANEAAAVDLHPGQEATVIISFNVEGEALQRSVRAVNFYERATAPNGRDVATVRIPLPPPHQPPATPAPPATSAANAALKAYEGRYRTNRNTTLTLRVEGQELVGDGQVVGSQATREHVRLTLHGDGSLRGILRDTDTSATGSTTYQLNLRFSADSTRFAGMGGRAQSGMGGPISYSGERIAPDAAAGAASTTSTASAAKLGASASGFVEGGYLALRADMARHSQDQYGRPRIEIGLTGRNTLGQRRSLQHNTDRFFLVTADGVEHRADGNYYGASADDRLLSTVWVEKDEEAQVTYVFPGIPATTKPARLIVRDSMNRQQLAVLDLSSTAAQRRWPTGDSAAASPGSDIGQPVMLGQYEVTLEKVERGPDGVWQSVMTLKNAGQAPVRAAVNSVNAVLYGADGQARHTDGNWYDPASTSLTALRDPGTIQPGQQFRVRRLHPHSSGLTPVRIRVQEGQNSGEITLTGLARVP